jgi:MoaA/NifB/PqqE/SkfB family radical SAM enzyme
MDTSHRGGREMNIDGPYSPLKAANVAHHHRMQALARGEMPPPAQVHLVITNRCNHNCSFCAYRSDRSTCSENFDVQDQIPWSRGEALIHELAAAGVGAIQFTGGGEPTVHPNFEDFYRLAQQLGMHTALVTNGSRLHKFDQDLLQRSAWIRVSVDAARAKTHEAIRGTKDFHKVLQGLAGLVKHDGQGPIIGMGFVVSPENYMEVGEAIALAGHLEIDNIRISAAFYAGAAEEHAQYAEHVETQIRCYHDRAFPALRVFDLFTDRLRDLEQERPDYSYCPISRLVPYVAADMNVYSCCVNSYSDQGLIGSIAETPFDKLWGDAGGYFANHTARRCIRCMFNEKNHFLSYMVNDAEHVNFI